MIDHIAIFVNNYERSKKFYIASLASIGYALVMEGKGFAGFGPKNAEGSISFWIYKKKNSMVSPIHVAFNASNRSIVDNFYKEAIKANGKDNGKPGIREIYHPNYYAAFVLDLDGNNIEVVCHQSFK